MKKPFLLVLFALCLGLLRSGAAEWVLRYELTVESTTPSPEGVGGGRFESRVMQQTVVLGEDTLVVITGEKTTVYDFKARRVRTYNSPQGTVADHSLYSVPAFLEHELLNRNALGGALRAAGARDMEGMMDRFQNETVLHMLSRKTPETQAAPDLSERANGAALEFLHEGKVVASCTPAADPLPEKWRHRFTNYLAYECDLHPLIRALLVDRGLLPQTLQYRTDAMRQVKQVTLQLQHSAASAASGVSATSATWEGTEGSGVQVPARAVAQREASSRFDAMLARVEAQGVSFKPSLRQDAVAFARVAVEEKKPLDALLALMEHMLETGESVAEELKRIRPAVEADPVCRVYTRAMSFSQAENAQKGLDLNASLQRSGLLRAHMLELQKANFLQALGKVREAEAAFLEVLEANPRHAGALHDLGMLYARTFEHGKAWQCWDAARKLYPAHPMYSDVRRIEQDLVRNHPAFF